MPAGFRSSFHKFIDLVSLWNDEECRDRILLTIPQSSGLRTKLLPALDFGRHISKSFATPSVLMLPLPSHAFLTG